MQQNSNVNEISDLFNQYYPQGIISETQLELLPKSALNQFEGYSKRFILPKEYKKGNFEQLYKIQYNNNDQTFVATQNKTFDLIYLIDTNQENIKTGHGEIIIRRNHNLTNIPDPCGLVAFIGTDDNFTRQGLGERRLCVMNALSQSLHNVPLYISGIIKSTGEPFFEKMSEKGLITLQQINEHNGKKEYLFKQKK